MALRPRFLPTLLALMLLSAAAPAQATWWVDAAGVPPGSGSPNDPYVEIQVALAAATTVDGDRIRVRPGVYLESDIDFLGKQVEIVSTAFEGKLPLERHRMVYAIFNDVMGGALHALSLKTRTPGE